MVGRKVHRVTGGSLKSLKYCLTPHPPKAGQHERVSTLRQVAAREDTGETLYLKARWVCLYASDEQKVDLDRVQDCHRTLNLVYAGGNTDEWAKVPDNDRYPFRRLATAMNIQFLPLDASQVTVEYLPINATSLDGTNPVDDAASRAGITPGVMNFYIGACDQGILGQAQLESNICFGQYSATGGFRHPGTYSPYHLGKTWPHETGHALSLFHTFADDVCDRHGVYPDVPEQVAPNFEAAWDAIDGLAGDNRDKDRRTGSSLSCLSTEPTPDTAPNEMSCNIMDYGNDLVSVMFTPSQVSQARRYLLSAANTTLTLQPAPASVPVAVPESAAPAAAATANLTAAALASPGAESTSSSSSDDLWSWLKWVIIAVGVLAVLLVAWWWWSRSPTTRGRSAGPAADG